MAVVSGTLLQVILLSTIENENDRKIIISLSQHPLYLTMEEAAPVFRRTAGTVIQHLLQQRFYIKEEWLAFGRPFFFFLKERKQGRNFEGKRELIIRKNIVRK